MSHELSLSEIKKEYHGSYRSYLIGFVTSLVLTFISFSLVGFEVLSGKTLIYVIVVLALIQAIIQLLFFLHLGQEEKPRWDTLIFGFMVLVLLILALGSLWIMYDLDERVMSNMVMEKTHD
jgi:cytochrome o ubiquinol oxidase operon protein cyoD